ncbi:LysR family transcriptional regulator [Clostridium sp. YIM B02551]|uniref:LysR family transcriptional regulator n=1 Tax=Clostridium sp. YIM B02551 TaxID=2910679 RepID=UPI001EEB3A7B|nr:LysR family transcriptional regulator [Clostridium sp. YIM B02551]
MDLKQLKYFLTISEEGQITAAAKRLHMAQPPLSHQLKLLEEELNVKLFDRGARSLQLTDAGKILKNRAEQIINLSEYAINEITDFSNGLNGSISIGTVSSSGTILLNNKITEFHNKYSGIKFELYEGNTFKVLDLLDKGVIELGVVRTPFATKSYNCIYTDPEPMIAVMTKSYLESESSTISIKDLKGIPLIIYRRFEQLISDTCVEEGFTPNIFCKNDDARTTILWANAGLGVGIIPKSAFPLAYNKNLYTKVILNENLTTRIALIWSKSKYISALSKKFIESFKED